MACNRNRSPAPRHAVPLRMSSQLVGKRVQSKFCSSKVIEPNSPASELTPTPNINRPVIASSAVMLKGSGGAVRSPPSGGPPRNGEFSLKIGPGRYRPCGVSHRLLRTLRRPLLLPVGGAG